MLKGLRPLLRLAALLLAAACAAPAPKAPATAAPILLSREVGAALDTYLGRMGATDRGAFAVSLNGADYGQLLCDHGNCGAAMPRSEALFNCAVKAQDDCRLLAANDDVLAPYGLRPLGWRPPPPPPPPPPLSGGEILTHLVGHKISGKIAGYGPFTADILPDGGFIGEGRGELSGRWSISIDRFCIDRLNALRFDLCGRVAIQDGKMWLIGHDDRLRQFYKLTVSP